MHLEENRDSCKYKDEFQRENALRRGVLTSYFFLGEHSKGRRY